MPHDTNLSYPLGDSAPGRDEAIEVGEGMYLIRMPLPFALNHVNLWLLRDCLEGREGWTVVDCGIDTPETRQQWSQLFATTLRGLPVLRVVVTHMHPDHIGLAHWICGLWEAPFHISATDYYAARVYSSDSAAVASESTSAFFASHGLREAQTQSAIQDRAGYYRSMVPAVPPQFRRLMDGTVIGIGGRAWTCVVGHGHTPEHMALFNATDRILIGGDMMLPRISTNISVNEVEPDGNPLKLFLDSLDRMAQLPGETLVLPSHGKPFIGIHPRVGELKRHHQDRLGEIVAAARERALTAADTLPILFKRALDLHQLTFAMGEAIAHLNYLWLAGKLRRDLDSEGTHWFSSVETA